jgi:hypothetical protein
VVEQRTYIKTVITILTDEDLYKMNMPDSVFTEINIRISKNYHEGLTIRQCVDNIAHDIFNKVA